MQAPAWASQQPPADPPTLPPNAARIEDDVPPTEPWIDAPTRPAPAIRPPTPPPATAPRPAVSAARVATPPPVVMPAPSRTPVAVRGRPATTSEVNEVHATPAPLWRRLLGFVVDAAVVGAVVYLFLLLAALVTHTKLPQTQMTGLDLLVVRVHALERILIPGVVLAAVLAMAYSIACIILWDGRTLGRRLLGIQLVDQSGFAPRPLRAVVRAVLSLFSFAFFLGGYWLALVDRRGQTLHDKLTSTFVVRPS